MNFSSLVRLPIVPFAILAPVVLAATAAADILTQPPESGGRVFIGGGGNAQLITFDDAAVTNGLRQQWVFLDFDLDAILNQVPVGQSVTGARLEWFGKFNGGATLNDTIYSVFEIEGDDLGRAAILAEGIEPVDPPESGIEGHGGDDVVSYYATHTAYGAVTDTEIEESDGDNLVSWDILELVQAWEAGTAQNPGSLIILNNQNPNFSGDSQGEGSGHGGDRDWINWNSTNASPSQDISGAVLVLLTELPGNGAPVSLALESDPIFSSLSVGAAVGTLSTEDPNVVSDVHTYTLVSGAGDTNNAFFQTNGDSLELAQSILAVGDATLSARLRSTDLGGLSVEGIVEVTVIADTDADLLPDLWEEMFFPGDLTALDGSIEDPIDSGSGSGDFDGDSISDAREFAFSTNPMLADTDDDGLDDFDEIEDFGTNPTKPDTDDDGLEDLFELDDSFTDPLLADTDGDGLDDGPEVNTHNTDPNDPDSDGDLANDGIEIAAGMDPAQAGNDIAPNWTPVGADPVDPDQVNHARVFISNLADTMWINFDSGTVENDSRQQWQWMDLSESLARIPAEEVSPAVLLVWSGTHQILPSAGNPTIWSVFAVPDDFFGLDTIPGDTRTGTELVDYYSSASPIGGVTNGQIASSAGVGWDITALVQAWRDGTITENVGQLIILNDRNSFAGPSEGTGHLQGREWVNWDPAGPVVLVEFEPVELLPFNITSIDDSRLAADRTVEITFLNLPDQMFYTVEYSTDLTTWVVLDDQVMGSDTSETSYDIILEESLFPDLPPSLFFRVVSP